MKGRGRNARVRGAEGRRKGKKEEGQRRAKGKGNNERDERRENKYYEELQWIEEEKEERQRGKVGRRVSRGVSKLKGFTCKL